MKIARIGNNFASESKNKLKNFLFVDVLEQYNLCAFIPFKNRVFGEEACIVLQRCMVAERWV